MQSDERSAIERLAISLEREAEVPLGVQLAWAIRARVRDGRLPRGERLPGLRELAHALGINLNTVRAVYKRLESDGVVLTQHGSGTYVAGTADPSSAVSEIASQAADDARATRVDPRDIAAALYMAGPNDASPEHDAAARRRQLRRQIAALEQALGELQAKHLIAPPSQPSGRSRGPRLLGVEELEEQRNSLIQALASAMDAPGHSPEPPEPDAPTQSADAPAPRSRTSRTKPSGKIAPAGT